MPSRGRGRIRFQALLEATEDLLKTLTPDSVGLYQIAEKANVPPASVYHFFPTKEAAYLALAQRFLDGLPGRLAEPIQARTLHSWQDVLAIDLRRTMAYYNENPPAMKILYGGYGGVESRNIDMLVGERQAAAQYDRLNRIFEMPFLRHPEQRFELRIAILDGIWAVAVRKHGYITEEYYGEALKACTAYTRLFLPEHVAPRDTLVEAALRDEPIRLPYVQDQEA